MSSGLSLLIRVHTALGKDNALFTYVLNWCLDHKHIDMKNKLNEILHLE